MAHLTEEQLVWFYYGETEEIPALEIHLEHCADCKSRLSQLKADMLAVEQWPVPERSPNYGEETWRALVRRDASIASRKRNWKRWLLGPKQLVLAGTLASVLIAGFFAGRFLGRGSDFSTPPEVARQRILAAALSEHLEESENVLIEVANRDAGSGLDIRAEQERAETLLEANRLYRMTAAREGRPELTSVLEDLERVLIDVKNSPSNLTAEDLDAIRSRMDDGLLFKVRVLNGRLRDLLDRPVERRASKDSKS